MITVGIRELKNNLSYYLRGVKKGRPVTITERGQSVAVLMPAETPTDASLARELSRKGIGTWKGGEAVPVRRSLKASRFRKSLLKNGVDSLRSSCANRAAKR
jgi:prevent-host-death family protein